MDLFSFLPKTFETTTDRPEAGLESPFKPLETPSESFENFLSDQTKVSGTPHDGLGNRLGLNLLETDDQHEAKPDKLRSLRKTSLDSECSLVTADTSFTSTQPVLSKRRAVYGFFIDGKHQDARPLSSMPIIEPL